MSEPDAEPTPSLIQQRLELGRWRLGALIMMIGWGVMTVLRAITFDAGSIVDGVMLIVTFALALYGVKLWFDYRRKVRAFEDEHGPDAGRQ
ncbi:MULTISPECIES: hypothetical protein [unclassified Microbacterium]|uniref:hypothetical protein n=1 Tax=unclassified Microbacterium TaxID=2609290 RepID=UPI001604C23C|nr:MULTISPECIES: hypothetical protein [unclassified Microbacterium]QNA92741.1 hypothetical protein G4G29_10845 [Microbacterium sp. Se63.02b]QYM62882.1 hypothetical protein K1X59_10880 [Microbacterium sp. Se5.02b]